MSNLKGILKNKDVKPESVEEMETESNGVVEDKNDPKSKNGDAEADSKDEVEKEKVERVYIMCELCDKRVTEEGMQTHIFGKGHQKKIKAANAMEGLQDSKYFTLDTDNNKYSCSACNLILNSAEQLELHARGVKHLKQVGAQQAVHIPTPSPAPVTTVKKPASTFNCTKCDVFCNSIQSYQQHISSNKHYENTGEKVGAPTLKGEFYCDLCSIGCNSSQQYALHLSSARHRDSVSSGRAPGPPQPMSAPMSHNKMPTVTVIPAGGGTEGLTCFTCGTPGQPLRFNSSKQFHEHMTGQKHAAKLSNSFTSPHSSVAVDHSRTNFTTAGVNKHTGQREGEYPPYIEVTPSTVTTAVMYRCKVCETKCNSPQQIQQHLVSSKHRDNCTHLGVSTHLGAAVKLPSNVPQKRKIANSYQPPTKKHINNFVKAPNMYTSRAPEPLPNGAGFRFPAPNGGFRPPPVNGSGFRPPSVNGSSFRLPVPRPLTYNPNSYSEHGFVDSGYGDQEYGDPHRPVNNGYSYSEQMKQYKKKVPGHFGEFDDSFRGGDPRGKTMRGGSGLRPRGSGPMRGHGSGPRGSGPMRGRGSGPVRGRGGAPRGFPPRPPTGPRSYVPPTERRGRY